MVIREALCIASRFIALKRGLLRKARFILKTKAGENPTFGDWSYWLGLLNLYRFYRFQRRHPIGVFCYEFQSKRSAFGELVLDVIIFIFAAYISRCIVSTSFCGRPIERVLVLIVNIRCTTWTIPIGINPNIVRVALLTAWHIEILKVINPLPITIIQQFLPLLLWRQ